jgi:hypothetical protein
MYAAMAECFVNSIFGTSRQLAVTSTPSSTGMLDARQTSIGRAIRSAGLSDYSRNRRDFSLGGALKEELSRNSSPSPS